MSRDSNQNKFSKNTLNTKPVKASPKPVNNISTSIVESEEKQFSSILIFNINNILDMFETTQDGITDSYQMNNEVVVVFSRLAHEVPKAVEAKLQKAQAPKEDLVVKLAIKFLEKFQNSIREFKKDLALQYRFKPNEIKSNKIDADIILGIFYLTDSFVDNIISKSPRGILIPNNTVVAKLMFAPSGKMFLELISYEDLLRKYFVGPRVLTEVQLNLASDFLKILNSMVMDSNMVVPLNVGALKFKPDDLLGLLQILEQLQLKYIHLMPLEKDYKYGSNNDIAPEKIAQINQLINKINTEISRKSTLFSSKAHSLFGQNIPEPSSPDFFSNTVGPAVVGPAVVGPAVVGPAVVGPAVAGPAVAGPAGVGPKGGRGKE